MLHTRQRRPTVPAAERRRIAEEQARANCRRGEHTILPLLRPNEEVCKVCGLWTYCPVCLDRSSLPAPQSRHARPMLCHEHQAQEVKP